MKHLLRGKLGGTAAFLIIAGLVAGGLGWATDAALSLERERHEQRAREERDGRVRLALWRLDSRVAPLLSREDARPFNHYSAVYAPALAFNSVAACMPPGTVMEPSPLLTAELPPWMRLHFQADATGWVSPQVLSPSLTRLLHNRRVATALPNVTPERKQVLAELARGIPASTLLQTARKYTAPATIRDTALLVSATNNDIANYSGLAQSAEPAQQQANSEYRTRSGYRNRLMYEGKNPQRYDRKLALNSIGNGEVWFKKNWPGGLPVGKVTPPREPLTKPAGGPASLSVVPGPTPAASTEVLVKLSPMVPRWVSAAGGREELLVFRLVHIENKDVCQGVLLDGTSLQEVLAAEVKDLFPDARLVPVREEVPSQPERTMTTLPLRLEIGPAEPVAAEAGWTPLRVGLALAWTAALVALLAVGLGGWSLIDLSERRIRFVSAVTHELRTPLTTLRLYLDMLLNGLVRDEQQRGEYIRTLHAEADRLNRLVGNVLDFSRLEKQRPHLVKTPVAVGDLLGPLQATWHNRCQDAGKELVVDNQLGPEVTLVTDGELLQQALGNLIDNSCKYSRQAEDRRLWVRACAEGRRLVFEVEDRGPGVPAGERRSIFRPFRRGRGVDATAGGVGLGLALSRRWVRLLGGRLTLREAPPEGGACFRLEFPGPTT